RLGLDEVLFIPNQVAPHRPDRSEIAPAEDRYVMVCLALAGNPHFRASRVEVDRPGVSYTVDTLRQMRGLRPGASFTFITGADSLLRYRWRSLDQVLDMVEHFAVAARPGFDLACLEERLQGLDDELRARVRPLPIPMLDISASEVRRRVREGLPYRYFTPDPVADYIAKNGLYLHPFAVDP
ncbi:MAG TPA: nicotinate-nucleotide adenylyltransferase, partial [Candidatus Nitrosotenuis sp.]|nr:nicotinate-nucleotide adenylyltransferase [Candidatus Nitrosotenuis sp.]